MFGEVQSRIGKYSIKFLFKPGLLDANAAAEQDAHAGASMGVKALPTLQRDCSNSICIRKSLNATKTARAQRVAKTALLNIPVESRLRSSKLQIADGVSGRLLNCRRAQASKLLGDRSSYIFQLDIDEDPGDNPEDAYSVDALHCGMELTLDYNPAEQEVWESKKYKEKSQSKKRKSRRQKRCLCGARNYREWISVTA
ncbi:hypothetical protein B0H13DRAFT_2471590 [Mycena leptocephala]|nr:hypothetical protein B0H13DRAFT_2471590 [Mycena leptocephala]